MPVYPRRAPLTGFVYTGMQGHDNATENPVSPKSRKACATAVWLPLVVDPSFAWGSAAVASTSVAGTNAPGTGAAGTAAASATERVSVVDTELFGVLGVYAQHCSVIHDASDAAPVAPVQTTPDPVVPPSHPVPEVDD
jgi:hypothetical protein